MSGSCDRQRDRGGGSQTVLYTDAGKEGEVGVEASVIKPTCVHHAPFLHQAKHVQDGSIRFVAWVCLIICNDKGWVHWGHKCDIIYSAGSRPGYHS